MIDGIVSVAQAWCFYFVFYCFRHVGFAIYSDTVHYNALKMHVYAPSLRLSLHTHMGPVPETGNRNPFFLWNGCKLVIVRQGSVCRLSTGAASVAGVLCLLLHFIQLYLHLYIRGCVWHVGVLTQTPSAVCSSEATRSSAGCLICCAVLLEL